jgi:multicomponent Na+:H+ antiporter subunit A
LPVELYLSVLLGLMLVAALVAAEARDLLTTVIAVGVVGLGTSAAFLVLGAPDLAAIQGVVGVVILAVLVRRTSVRDETVVAKPRDAFATAAGLLAVGVLLLACTAVLVRGGPGRRLPVFGKPVSLQPYESPEDAKARLTEARKDDPRAVAEERGVSRLYLDESWAALDAAKDKASFDPKGHQVHLHNRTTAVLLEYRGYDTLAQIAAVLAAVIGAVVVLRRKSGAEGEA